MRKLTFTLTEEQAGPFPISTESLWCEEEGDNFRVKNIPFFIDGLSFDDLILVSQVEEGLYKVCSVIEQSGNSTIWILIKKPEGGNKIIDGLHDMGCGVEGGVFKNYFSVNVPISVEIDKVLQLIEAGKTAGYLIADFPSIRGSKSMGSN